MFYPGAHCLVIDNLPLSSADDRDAYLRALVRLKAARGLKLPAYALLTDRALLYFVLPDGDPRAAMREFRPDTSRCKYKLLQPEKYSAALTRFIHLEPVKTGLAAKPEDYRWSSAAQYLGLEDGPADRDLTAQFFAGNYREYMAEPVPGKLWRPFDKNRDAVLGDRDFTNAHSPHDR